MKLYGNNILIMFAVLLFSLITFVNKSTADVVSSEGLNGRRTCAMQEQVEIPIGYYVMIQNIYSFYFSNIGVSEIGGWPTNLVDRDDYIHPTTIEVPIGYYVIFQKDDIFGAFKIIKELDNHNGWQYQWVLGADQSGRFGGRSSSQGTGKIFENYKLGKRRSGGYNAIDQGSQLYIRVGPDIKFEWSYPLWVYLPNGDENDRFRLKVTEVRELNDLNTSLLK